MTGEGTPPSEEAKSETSARERRRLQIVQAGSPEERAQIIAQQLQEDLPDKEKEELIEMGEMPIFDPSTLPNVID